MDLIGSMIIAFSMYSKIPMPPTEWTKERMKYAMCFFPLIGVVIGAAVAVSVSFLKDRGAGSLLISCIGTCIPLLVTGGIHMDGFLDVTDALSSYEGRERKLEIMKDPHAGAFAIIGCGLYLLLYVGFFSQLSQKGLLLFAGTFVLTRALSGLAVVTFPMAKTSGLAAAFSGQAHKKAVGLVMLGYTVLAGLYFFDIGIWQGFACLGASGLLFLWYYRMSGKKFGGITGDLAGYFLQVAEMVLLITIVIVS